MTYLRLIAVHMAIAGFIRISSGWRDHNHTAGSSMVTLSCPVCAHGVNAEIACGKELINMSFIFESHGNCSYEGMCT